MILRCGPKTRIACRDPQPLMIISAPSRRGLERCPQALELLHPGGVVRMRELRVVTRCLDNRQTVLGQDARAREARVGDHLAVWAESASSRTLHPQTRQLLRKCRRRRRPDRRGTGPPGDAQAQPHGSDPTCASVCTRLSVQAHACTRGDPHGDGPNLFRFLQPSEGLPAAR